MSKRTIATGLIAAGTLLNMLRMAPIFASEGFSFSNLPPDNAEAAASVALLGGWYPSHMMAIVSVPLLIGGFVAIQRDVRARARGTNAETFTFLGLLGLTAALTLYLVAGVLDGIALQHAAHQFAAASGPARQTAGVVLMAIHETAISFGGHFMGIALIATGIFAAGLRSLGLRSVLPTLGILLGAGSFVGLSLGALDLSFKTGFPLLGGVVGIMMAWWLGLAFSQFSRLPSVAASATWNSRDTS